MARTYKQLTINKSFFAKLEALEQEAEDAVKDTMTNLAALAVSYSPVDTGAYVTSFSIVPSGSGGGRMRSSKDKPRGQDLQAMRDQGYQQMIQDLNRIDMKTVKSLTLRNRSPHAKDVEDGGVGWRRDGYHVFRKLRNDPSG